MGCIDVPPWSSLTSRVTSVGSPHRLSLTAVTLTLAKCKTSEKKDPENMRTEKWPPALKPFLFFSCFLTQAKQGQKDFDTEKQQHNWGIRPLRDLELLVKVGH